MKEIGGYFSFELNSKSENLHLHEQGIFLNTGRNAFEYILQTLPVIKKIWIPYYTCDVVLEPLIKLNIDFSFYHINEKLEISDPINIKDHEYILYTNYFGIKDSYVEILKEEYTQYLIVDNSQALFSTPTDFSFYSPRKFIGLPDGGIAYSKYGSKNRSFEIDLSYDRCSHLLKRLDLPASEGYYDFKRNNKDLKNQPIKYMSKLSKRLFDSIQLIEIKEKRKNNFSRLHAALANSNLLSAINEGEIKSSMIYPYLTDNPHLRSKLIENKIYVATYWPNVIDWCKSSSIEYRLAEKIIPIPIDQRYGIADMDYIIEIIEKNI